RTDEVLETVDRWRARGDVAWAEVLAAAYLDAPVERGVARLPEAATRMVEPGWFRDRLLVRLADRADDGGARAAILAEARARTAPLMYVPLLWLARRRLFAPVGVGLTRGLGWLPAPGGWRALVWTTALLVGAGTAIDLALGLLSEATNMSSHWTEWFDEDLAWGSP